MVSLDDHLEAQRLFGGWHLQPVDLACTAQRRVGKRYRELLRMEIAASGTSAEEIDEEIRYLKTILASE